jgi:hypothetical protein
VIFNDCNLSTGYPRLGPGLLIWVSPYSQLTTISGGHLLSATCDPPSSLGPPWCIYYCYCYYYYYYYYCCCCCTEEVNKDWLPLPLSPMPHISGYRFSWDCPSWCEPLTRSPMDQIIFSFQLTRSSGDPDHQRITVYFRFCSMLC